MAATVDTTRAESTPTRARPRGRRSSLPWLSLLLSGLLLALAWPRLQASLLYLPVDRAIARHWSGEPIAAVQLPALSQRARAAFRRHPHYRYEDGLSLLSYLTATHPDTLPSERRAALEASAEHARNVVAKAPLQPMTWYRIAAASSSLGTDSGHIAAALEMSMLAGRVEPTLVLPRLQLAYRYRRWLGRDGQALLADQTLLAWRLQPRRLVQLWRQGSLSFSEVAQVLAAGHPDILAEMEEAIVRSLR